MTSDSRMREILAECLSGVEFRDVHEESALEAMRRVRAEVIEECAKVAEEYPGDIVGTVIRALYQPKDENLEIGSGIK